MGEIWFSSIGSDASTMQGMFKRNASRKRGEQAMLSG